ncbi:MAG: hypothetical protein ACRDBP_07515 [Luteolibacter sp.]
MSLLPQSKKSAEEIAKLRESLGIVGPPPAEDALPVAAPIPNPLPPAPQGGASADSPVVASLHAAENHEPKPVSSLKRSERSHQLPNHHEAAHEKTPPVSAAPLTAPHLPKAVRSLRKSEQGPIAPLPPPPPDSKLPVHRHTEKEIKQIRRQEMLSGTNLAGHMRSSAAHPVWIVIGYLLAIAPAIGIYFYDIQKELAGGCAAAALLVAAIIFFRKPLSIHHAAFIAVVVLLVVVFGALHYFPQLRHGT